MENLRSIRLLLLVFTFSITSVKANPLKDLLHTTLQSAPEVLEATANVDASLNRTEQSKAGHWPVVSVTGSGVITQHYKNSTNTKSRITPGVKAEMNLYSFGAIDKEIEKNVKEEEFYQHKLVSTQEELAYTVSQLYLKALNLKEAIRVMKHSLARHNAILGSLDVIVDNDGGRLSEYTQAEARMLTVEQNINRYSKQLAVTLNTLSKYSNVKITAEDLQNPFQGLTDNVLFAKYTAKDKSQNPSYKAQHAEWEAKRLAVEVESKKELPKVNLVGYATRDDQYIGVEVSWDILNRGSRYTVQEKEIETYAAKQRLERLSRDLEEVAQQSLINIKESRMQLKTLKAQINASRKVVDFYKLQFDTARRSLLDVLNAEKDLAEVELTQANTEAELSFAILDYLYSQGTIATWANQHHQTK
ncbi:TolC family protein [Glaesserella sp.]|uniref:TolC family protein n=1 Tax=Glaesserella sp. TaxID=2094731 RepID=UPI0035A1C216